MMSRKPNRRDWSALGWAVTWFLLAGSMIYDSFQERDEFQAFKEKSVTTTGVVTSASHGYRSRDDGEPPSITYRFFSDGIEYTGYSSEYLPEGSDIKIRFLREEPSTNTTINYEHSSRPEIYLSVLCILIGGYMFMIGFSDATIRLAPESVSHTVTPSSPIRFLIVISASISAYLLFNNYISADDSVSKYLKYFGLLTVFAMIVISFIWGKKTLCLLSQLILSLMIAITLMQVEHSGWFIAERIAGFILLVIAYNLKITNTEKKNE